jgi:large subunit ribosomal protein L31
MPAGRRALALRHGAHEMAPEEIEMKAGVHPVYKNIRFKCVCGNIIETRSAIESAPAADGFHHLEICAACHPFFTGKQKLMDKAGRVERFRRRYTKKGEAAATPGAGTAETS